MACASAQVIIYNMNDTPRRAATSPDQYTLNVEDAAVRYEHAGHPRTYRTIQRYCAKAHLDCLKQETPFGDKYLITPESLSRHIAQIEELASANSRDGSRPDASPVALQTQPETLIMPPPTGPGLPRQDVTDDRYVARLEGEIGFLREQIVTKDGQIRELTERSRETNHLIAGLQKMLTPLLGRSADIPPDTAAHSPMEPGAGG